MDYSLFQGIGNYLTNPYLSGLYSGMGYPALGSSYLTTTGVTNAFQSGVRFGQALEKAMEKNPDSAGQLQEIWEEAFQGQKQSVSAGSWTVQSTAKSAGQSAERPYGQLSDYLAGRRETRIQQRLAQRQSGGRQLI